VNDLGCDSAAFLFYNDDKDDDGYKKSYKRQAAVKDVQGMRILHCYLAVMLFLFLFSLEPPPAT
jgi:hypothetical protein